MSVILPARRFHQRSQPFKLQRFKSAARPDVTTGLRKRSWKWMAERRRRRRRGREEKESEGSKKMSKQIFIFPRKSARKTGAEAIWLRAPRKTCVACSYIILYGRLCPGYTLRSFTLSNLVRAIFGREAWFTRRHKNPPSRHPVDITTFVYSANLLPPFLFTFWVRRTKLRKWV